MPISKSSELFSLIKSLSKSEKRNFKLYAGRNHIKGQLKFIELFDILDKAVSYDEKSVLENLIDISKAKLPNLKRHLYTQILGSLRVITVSKRPNVELRGLIDYAYILYDKAFYLEALKVLDKAKRYAEKYNLYYSHLSIIEFEKRIESRHITRSGRKKAMLLIEESDRINTKVSSSVHLSNLRTHLHGYYLQHGHCQSFLEKKKLEELFDSMLRSVRESQLGPVEKVYLYQSYVWYSHILLDFESCLQYAGKWLEVIESEPLMIERDVDLYLRGFHYALSSCYHLRAEKKLNTFLIRIEAFRKSNYKKFTELTKIISFQYVHSARLNQVIINGDFEKGKVIMTKALKRINRYKSHIDAHRILVFYFKFAWIHFGNQNYSKSIFYLSKIINNELQKLREDLQIYARLLFLMCHYELANYDMFNYSITSFTAYFKKIENTQLLQDIIQKAFLELAIAPKSEHKTIMKKTLEQLNVLRENSFHNVSFNYLDVISWLETKIHNKSLTEIIKSKLEAETN